MSAGGQVTVRVTRAKVHRRGGRFAWYWVYEAFADDAERTRFDNDSIVTLRDVLRRKYGRDVRIVETWKGSS